METKTYSLDSKVEALRESRQRAGQQVVRIFDDSLDQSWIYHDNALEGIVITHFELKAAIDKRIISDVTLIPTYEEIKNHKLGIEWTRATAREWAAEKTDRKAKRKNLITLETFKHVHGILAPDEKAKGSPFRKENPLHRTYYHEIGQPDKILPRLKKLVEWLDEEETAHLHPVERAARFHFRFMSIFPWVKNSGKVARLIMNLMLLRDGFPPVIIHANERQRYYDGLRTEGGSVPLIYESLENGIDWALRFFSEFAEARRGQRVA
jgi:Fic family protein